MTGSIEHFFTIKINYRPITNLRNSLRNAQFSSLYSQLLNSKVKVKVKVKATLPLMVGQSVSLGVEPHLGLV
jgi:hypothetical protein